MTNQLKIGFSIIIGISLGVTFLAPINEMYKGIAALPAIGSLLAALFQLVRDEAAYQRSRKLLGEQQLFNLGATSHMANTVFDKHVEFSEKYLSEVQELVVTLTKKGPTQTAVEHAGKLYTLRVEYAAWITPEIEEQLLPFEKAVREIGANASLAEAYSGEEGQQENRKAAVADMYEIFRSVLDIEKTEMKDEDATVAAVKKRIREILQVKELVEIREFLIHKAHAAANK